MVKITKISSKKFIYYMFDDDNYNESYHTSISDNGIVTIYVGSKVLSIKKAQDIHAKIVKTYRRNMTKDILNENLNKEIYG